MVRATANLTKTDFLFKFFFIKTIQLKETNLIIKIKRIGEIVFIEDGIENSKEISRVEPKSATVIKNI